MIMNANELLFEEMLNLTALKGKTEEGVQQYDSGEIVTSAGKPYVSSYANGAVIKDGLHPFNGNYLRLTARVLDVLPAAADDGEVNLYLFTNEISKNSSGEVIGIGDTCSKLVATYGPIKATDMIMNDGLALQTIIPENLGTKLQLKAAGTSFDAVSGSKPVLAVLLEAWYGRD